jgi:hypothetical protein
MPWRTAVQIGAEQAFQVIPHSGSHECRTGLGAKRRCFQRGSDCHFTLPRNSSLIHKEVQHGTIEAGLAN